MSLKKGGNLFRTVTFRLSLWYGVLFAIAGVFVFFFSYIALSSHLDDRMDEDLSAELVEFEGLLRMNGIDMLGSVLIEEALSEGVGRVFVRVISPEMKTLISSDVSHWTGIGPPEDIFTWLNDENPFFETIQVPGHTYPVRVVYKRMFDGSIIQIGMTIEENERFLMTLRNIYGSAIVSMIVCGCFIGWLVSRKAMMGVERVTQTAIGITGSDLSRRVPHSGEGTEIENLATAFNTMLDRIQTLVKELKEVTNNIAHDLRSPITRIRGMAETTLTGKQDIDDYCHMAQVVIDESDRLTGMINTMLEIAMTDSGAAVLSMDRIDISAIAGNACELFSIVAEDKGINLDMEISGNPVRIMGDHIRIQRVIANLLDNAIKYTQPGGSVHIFLQHATDQVRIEVTDTGIGIENKDISHIFERFYRVDKSRSSTGNGLGLSLVRSIVKAHGGEIKVESVFGKGSTFMVILPVDRRLPL